MAYTNNMSELLDKIEIRLGTRQLNLPDYLRKDQWPKIISMMTLTTFSRYIPHKFPITLTQKHRKNDYFLIDEDLIPSDMKILGIRDIKWDEFGPSSVSNTQSFGIYDFFANGSAYTLDDIAMVQMRADEVSLFNNGIFLDFEPPNKVKITSATGADVSKTINDFKIEVFLKHPDNLMTIPPTKMETFEELAIADVAGYLYNELKYYDGLETVYTNIDLKLTDLQDKASRRDDIVNQLKESYVSAGNTNQPIMFTV